ncbi:hypothetical protein SESBI_24241 [Sesbania bispinosa]|nr:hypothetical protein SESBI_24241 [Sesbania bispinosa]
MYDQQESWIPADLKFFSSFSLAWVFSCKYRYGKQENKNYLPILQRNAYVKWWAQFDHSKNPPRECHVLPLLQPLPETSIKMMMIVLGLIWEKTEFQG